jgi:ketosteroid isomerase-like protein
VSTSRHDALPDEEVHPMAGDAVATVTEFVDAFGRNDPDALLAVLADDFTGHVTTADGGTREVDRDGYAASVRAMDVGTANLQLTVPNVVEVGPGRVLVMVEVHAARGGRTLHNFSGQLLTVRDGRVTDLWMVEALPEQSDRFWSA